MKQPTVFRRAPYVGHKGWVSRHGAAGARARRR
jgi:hypothetical protein